MRVSTWAMVGVLLAGTGCEDEEPAIDTIRSVSVVIDPATPDTTVDLVALADDAENADATFEYQWSVNGSVDPNAFTDTIPSERTARDQTWEVTVWPSGEREGAGWSASATIANTPPTLSVEFDPVDPLPGEPVDLRIETGDIDSDNVTLAFEWAVDGVATTEVDGDRIPQGITQPAEEWSVTVTADDGADVTTVTEALRIGNRAPEIDAVTLQPAAFRHDEPVEVVVDATDPDGDAVELTYEWTVDGVVVGTDSGLDGTQYVRGQEVRVTVSASDGLLASEEVVASAITSNTPPVVYSARITPTEDIVHNSPLTCIGGETYDADGDEVTTDFAWLVDGTVEDRPTGDTPNTEIDTTLVRKDKSIVCRAIPNDGFDDGTYADSDPVVVGNTKPKGGSVSLSPLPPKTLDDLTVSVTAGTDVDGDPVTYTYAWEVNGKSVSTTGTTLASSNYVKGDVIKILVTPNDGTEDGPVRQTSTSVENTPPFVPSTSILPSSPATTQDLRCILTGSPSDDDSDPLTITYTWYLGFTPWTGTTKDGGKTIPSSSTRSYQRWSCQVKVSDGTTSVSNSGGSVTIR